MNMQKHSMFQTALGEPDEKIPETVPKETNVFARGGCEQHQRDQ